MSNYEAPKTYKESRSRERKFNVLPGTIYAGTALGSGPNESLGLNLAHEGMHRGYKILLNDPRTKGVMRKYMSRNEERQVRDAEISLFNPPKHGFEDTDEIRANKEGDKDDYNQHIIRALENPGYYGLTLPSDPSKPVEYDYKKNTAQRYREIPGGKWNRIMAEVLAADLIAKRRPGGPR